MEVSVIGCSQFPVGRKDCVPKGLSAKPGISSFGVWRELKCERRRKGLGGNGVRRLSVVVAADGSGRERVVVKEKAVRGKKNSRVPMYVALPIDTVSDANNVNHVKAISTGLKALKLLGVEGVSVPIWWGVVENESAGKFNWTAYQALAEMVEKSGLKLHVSLFFHARSTISLPKWVMEIGETQPDIFFKDRAGKRYKGCLSLAVDKLPVLAGKSPLEVYEQFLSEFKSSFSGFIGNTITDVMVGLGPDGELRYPSFPPSTKGSTKGKIRGVGEFQCYDKHMLEQLKQHAESSGNRDWGHSGPHDATAYDTWPQSGNFFKDAGGSWETPYGDFFLSWYSSQLTAHGDHILSLASKVFGDDEVRISGKLPLVHWWHNTRSHAAELTAGFYNSDGRNGYDAVAKVFSANSASLVLPGIDLSDCNQPSESRSSPQKLAFQILEASKENNVRVFGENTSVSVEADNFKRITEYLKSKNGSLETLVYNRMGADFFSPEHWPRFAAFCLDFPKKEFDDLPSRDGSISLTEVVGSEERSRELQMQA